MFYELYAAVPILCFAFGCVGADAQTIKGFAVFIPIRKNFRRNFFVCQNTARVFGVFFIGKRCRLYPKTIGNACGFRGRRLRFARVFCCGVCRFCGGRLFCGGRALFRVGSGLSSTSEWSSVALPARSQFGWVEAWFPRRRPPSRQILHNPCSGHVVSPLTFFVCSKLGTRGKHCAGRM